MLTKLKIRYILAFVIAAIATITPIAIGQNWMPAEAQNSPKTISLQSAGLQLQEVAQGTYALIASTDFPPTSPDVAIANGGIVIGSDSVLVIDPFQSTDLAGLMISTVKSLTDKPIKYVLNTHYHFDHTGGNVAFVSQNIPVFGRGVIREYIQSGRGDTGKVTPPTVIINSQTDIWLGDRQVRIDRVDGHSAGTDLVAYVPDAKVLFTGDMVFNQRIPYTADSDLRQWQGSLYRLIAVYPEAKVVPGHGNVTDVTGLQAQQAYFNWLERQALEWKSQILTKEQVLEKFAKVPDAYKDFKFKAIYPLNLESAYEQFTRSEIIPLIP
ncbi:MBL fold metallo-hydrolase [Pseudanabaena biceps]|nr:MBL fold metallo-hydrolase [Pseudanabaena biceps]